MPLEEIDRSTSRGEREFLNFFIISILSVSENWLIDHKEDEREEEEGVDAALSREWKHANGQTKFL